MRAVMLSMALALAAGGAAWAAETAQAQEKVVCKSKQKPNSRFTTRECHTVAEWEERREAARKAFAETQERPMINTQKGN